MGEGSGAAPVRAWLRRHTFWGDALAAGAGASGVLAFAPFEWRILAVLSPAVLILVWLDASPPRAFWRGYLYGLAGFGVGVSWVYNSIHEFGHAPAAMAAAITLAFVLFLALYPGLVGWACGRYIRSSQWLRIGLGVPVLWTLFEWLRSWVLTGFPWLLLGQAQMDGPLGGIIPLFGVLGASALTILISAMLVLVGVSKGRGRRWLAASVVLGVVLGAILLARVSWTAPAGGPLRVSLIQGNVSQDEKWRPERLAPTQALYADLTREHWDSRLIIWPETAIPMFYSDIDGSYFAPLAEEARRHGTDIITGIFSEDPARHRVYNSLVRLGEPPEFYHKRHLVPFGEFLPLRGLLMWMSAMIVIPMSDLDAGEGRPLLVAGDLVLGTSICYEDAYGNEVIDALPQANLLVNVSNDAWFGNSLAPAQHLEIARLRALETGRVLLRATNTGISAIIGPDGRIIARSPQFEVHVLSAQVRPRQGLTPFARWGNWGVVTVLVLALGIIAYRQARSLETK
jgi:apolipoprotein N-acyltransferase